MERLPWLIISDGFLVDPYRKKFSLLGPRNVLQRGSKLVSQASSTFSIWCSSHLESINPCLSASLSHFDHFRVYSSVPLIIFTLLGKHHHRVSPEHSVFPKWNSIPIRQWLPILPYPPLLAAMILVSFSVIWTTLGTPYEWNHSLFVLLCLLISLGLMSSRLIMLSHVPECPFFLRTDNILLSVYILSVYQCMDL